MSGYEGEIEELLGRYRRKLAELNGLQRAVEEGSAMAASADRSVQVTVNGQGEITSLEFPTGAFRGMSAAELSAEILAATREAKAKAREPLNTLQEPDPPVGARFLEPVEGGTGAAMPGVADPSGHAEDGGADPSGSGAPHT